VGTSNNTCGSEWSLNWPLGSQEWSHPVRHWVWEITGRSQILRENHQSFWRNPWDIPNFNEENRKITMYTWLDLGTLGFWLIMPKYIPGECAVVAHSRQHPPYSWIHPMGSGSQQDFLFLKLHVNKAYDGVDWISCLGLCLNKGCRLFLWTWLESFPKTSRKLCQKQA
jgi:hypothetical protein